MRLNPRRIPIRRPYPDEVPWELLPQSLADTPALERLRVAKLDNEVVGVYAFEQVSALHYHVTALAVAAPHRKQGLGRWLLGHAIGVCETKGAREITVPYPRTARSPTSVGRDSALPCTAQGAPPNKSAAHRLFSRAGFARLEAGYRLLLTPD